MVGKAMLWISVGVLSLVSFPYGHVQDEGVIGYRPFDEGSREVAHDRSGKENDGKICRAKYVSEGMSYALQFGSKTDEVRMYSRALSDAEVKRHYHETKRYAEVASDAQKGIQEQGEQSAEDAGGNAAGSVLAAHWRFDEGEGETLHDSSGNNNHGTIKGAKWVKNGDGYALELDGEDDCVDCGAGPSLDIRDKLSITTWVYPREREAEGDAGIVGKDYRSYVITYPYPYRADNRVRTYLFGGGANTYATLAPGQWHHVASTYDGNMLRLYIDGALASVKGVKLAEVKSGGHFWMGRSDGEVIWTKDAHFAGKISEVRVYRGALTSEEIAQLARTTNITHEVNLSVLPLPWRGKLLVDVNTLGLGPVEGGVTVDLRVLARRAATSADAETAAELTRSVSEFAPPGVASVELDCSRLAAGEYELEAVAKTTQNRKVGQACTVAFVWEGIPNLPSGTDGARKLNNLVTELLNVSGPDASGNRHEFVNPHRGWIFISNAGSDTVALRAAKDSRPTQVALADEYSDAHEAMRYLPAGKYIISTALAKSLVVRAIPTLAYSQHGCSPLVEEYGPFMGAFEEEHVFKNINSMDTYRLDIAKPWRENGKRSFLQCAVPKGTEEEPLTEEDVYEAITGDPRWFSPDVSGFLADEFEHSEPYCAVWAKVIDRVLSDPQSKGKLFNPWCNNLWDGEEGRELVSVIVKHNSYLLWKRYLNEQRTEAAGWRHIMDQMVYIAGQWRDKCPGAIPQIIVVIGQYSTPPLLLDNLPHVDYRAYLDMQFNLVATHPAFEGIGGIMTYLNRYNDEETVRLGARLFRHYGIEGRTEPLINDPYILSHLDNPDFERQSEGWSLSAAGENTIRFDISPGFGARQGRFACSSDISEGDVALVTRRSADRPNMFSQEIKNLEPGRLYSLRMAIGDFNDMSKKETHAVSVRIHGVDITRSITHAYDAIQKTPAALNYRWSVFRAKGTTARLTISDWADDNTPGGAIGQELIFNFIQVQPYLDLAE